MTCRLGAAFAASLCLSISLLSAAAASQPDQQEVEFQSQDGFVLSGRLYRADRSGPGILLVHQCNRTGPNTGFEALAPVLSEKGFHVLLYDSRGFGKSRNELYYDYHAQMESIDQIIEKDIEAAYQFLISQQGVDRNRMGIVAASCGTWQAIPLAQKYPQVRALVFLSGSYLGLEAVESAYEELTDRPVLAVYSEEDGYGTPESMQSAFKKSKNKASRLIAYKGTLHGTPLLSHDAGLMERIAMWFVSHLSGN